MNVIYPLTITITLALSWPTSTEACYWDRDTLAMERRAFPSIEALILGKTKRHSQAFYQWRVKDRLAKLEKAPNALPLLDDLAVAYDKIGERDKALATARRALEIDPKRYETLANLGTIHLHRREFAMGITFIKKALAINPNAHFGRERYQLYLAEFLLEMKKAKGRITLPLIHYKSIVSSEGTFAGFIAQKLGKGGELTKAQRKAAVKGIAGMLRFGQHDSPILLEALADLLNAPLADVSWTRGKGRHAHLATFALWRAAEVTEGPVRAAYERSAHQFARWISAIHDKPARIAKLKRQFIGKRKAADRWVARRHARETKLIAKGKSPER